MADATVPTAGNYCPGHAPFWLRVRREQETPGRVVEITDVQGGLITIRDGSTTETLWTHPTAARALADVFGRGLNQMSRYGRDVFIMKGFAMSLVDPAQESRCADPDDCAHHRVISVRTGEPWDIEDTLAGQERDES